MLGQTLQSEINALTGPLTELAKHESIAREIAAIDRLVLDKQAALSIKSHEAQRFYGTDPIDKTFDDFIEVVTRNKSHDAPKQSWLSSYKAAFEAKTLNTSIHQLSTNT